MKPWFNLAFVLFCLLAAGPGLGAQAQGGGAGSGKSQPEAGPPNALAAQQPSRSDQQNNQNPFPEDTSQVPVIPTQGAPGPAAEEGGDAGAGRITMPASDADPVRTPEDAAAAAEDSQLGSSSSQAGMRDLLPAADDATDTRKRKRKGQQVEPEHHETAAEDESVGKYYLDNQDWKAALSRYESALVLDPDNPDVYWGLAEAERRLGRFAEARAHYQKVVEYDPGSRHAKDAAKALADPQIANARAQAPEPSAPAQP